MDKKKYIVIKKENDVTILQIERWRNIVMHRSKLATELGLDKRFLMKILTSIHQESIRIQEK